jgi:hypothetical protein
MAAPATARPDRAAMKDFMLAISAIRMATS